MSGISHSPLFILRYFQSGAALDAKPKVNPGRCDRNSVSINTCDGEVPLEWSKPGWNSTGSVPQAGITHFQRQEPS